MLAGIVGGNIAHAAEREPLPPAGPGSPLVGSPIYVPPAGPGSPLVGSPRFYYSPQGPAGPGSPLKGSPQYVPPPAGPGSPLVGSPRFFYSPQGPAGPGSPLKGSPQYDPQFNPTIYGRVDTGSTSSYVVWAREVDFVEYGSGPAGPVDDTVYIWLIKTSDNCYIRVARNDATDSDFWYNTSGTSQGDPGIYTGTGSTVFELGEVPDSVNIWNKSDVTLYLTPTFSSFGTAYTSNNKVTFFNPTQDAKYGRSVYCTAFEDVNFEIDRDGGQAVVQYTFRKSGYDDYTVTFRTYCLAQAEMYVE